MTRGGSSVPRSTSIWVSRRASPPRRRAPGRRSAARTSRRSASGPSAARITLFPSSESATRRSVRMGDLLSDDARPIRDRDQSPRLSASAGRGAQAPGVARRPASGLRGAGAPGPADERCSAVTRSQRGLGTVDRQPDATSEGGAMASPMTQSRARRAARRAVELLDAVRRRSPRSPAPGAWCPALSPEGDRGRLRHRPLRHPAARGGPARRRHADGAVGPTEEVVSVAWSPDGGRLAYLVSPGGSICAELHVVPPTAPAAACSRGRTCARPSSPAAGPARALRLLHRARRRSGRRRRPGRRRHRRAAHPGPRRLPVGHRGVGRRAVRAGPPRPARLPAHRRDRRRHRVQRGCWMPTPPAASPRRTAGSRPTAARCTSAPPCLGPLRRPRRSRRGPARRGRRPGEGRVVLSRPDADLDGYALRTDGTVLAVWNVDGATELLVHALATARWCGRSRCPSRSCRAGRWPPTAPRWSPS